MHLIFSLLIRNGRVTASECVRVLRLERGSVEFAGRPRRRHRHRESADPAQLHRAPTRRINGGGIRGQRSCRGRQVPPLRYAINAATCPMTGALSAAGVPSGMASSGTMVSGSRRLEHGPERGGIRRGVPLHDAVDYGPSTDPPMASTRARRAYARGADDATSASWSSDPTPPRPGRPRCPRARRSTPPRSRCSRSASKPTAAGRCRRGRSSASPREGEAFAPRAARPHATSTGSSPSAVRRSATRSTPGSQPTDRSPRS